MNPDIEHAKIEAERARKRLAATLDEIFDKLTPGALANRAWSGVRDKGSELADGAVEVVKARPAATAGVIAAGLLFLARGRIVSAASRLVAGDDKSRPKSSKRGTKQKRVTGVKDGND